MDIDLLYFGQTTLITFNLKPESFLEDSNMYDKLNY